jgi:16S rRNA U516 pseudouridylate synthase RsuA-like enzyme
MFEHVGHHVEKIKRVRYGNLELDVEPGKWRALTLSEVQRLKSLAAGKARREPKPVRGTKDGDEQV